MDSTMEKDTPTKVQTESTATKLEPVSSFGNEDDEEYKMSWRTLGAFLALSICWSATSFAVVGPNSSIQYIINEFPLDSDKATWIANAPLFCLVTLPSIMGAASDRYGKKWFLLCGAIIAICGAVVSGTATTVNTVIGGQALNGIGGSAMLVTVPAGMEIVPAKYRTAVVALMALINGSLGVVGGVFVFAACVENGLGWRWGFRILACMFALVFVLVLTLFNPPPTRFRREQSLKELLRSIDFIGIFLLALGSALLTIPLVWGGSIYAWNSPQVIPFLVIGPLFLIAFGVYEWKGRSDGIMHHDFFESFSYTVFMVFGFVDGMLLYGNSVFIPNQIQAVYTNEPLGVARGFTAFNGCLLAGFVFFGFVSTVTKQFRWPLVFSSLLLTLFCGLTARSDASNEAYFEGMLGVIGFLTAATEVIPVAGLGLIVPSYLIATSNTVLVIVRALGGALGIAIFSVVYSSKAAVYIPEQVLPVLVQAGVPEAAYEQIITVAAKAPALLAQIPGLTPELAGAILQASRVGAAEGYKYVWYCLMASAAGCLLLSFFIVDVPHKMTNQVESVLEPSRSDEKKIAV